MDRDAAQTADPVFLEAGDRIGLSWACVVPREQAESICLAVPFPPFPLVSALFIFLACVHLQRGYATKR